MSEYVRDVQVDVPVSLIVDASETAFKPIDAALPAEFQKPIVQEIKPRIYRITFTPVRYDDDSFSMKLFYGADLYKK